MEKGKRQNISPAQMDGSREPQRATRPAPGKVTRTSKLSSNREAAVQCKAATPTPQAAEPQTRSRWDLTMDPWMDAAHRGVTALAERGHDMVQAAGPIQAKGLQENPKAPARLPGHGGGVKMPEEVRGKMEAAFGADFSSVRIHEGPHTEAIGALAYTQGTDIHFAPGQYQPRSQHGQELLGHELTHVIQQSQGRVQTTTQASGVDINDDTSLEREADEMGARAVLVEGSREAPSLHFVVQRVQQERQSEDLLDGHTDGSGTSQRVQLSPDDEVGGRLQAGRRGVITFIVGPDNDTFYREGFGYWQRGRADDVVRQARNLAAILDYLREPANAPPNGMPWGEINIVVHANELGGMGMGVDATDQDRATDDAEIRRAMGPGGTLRALPDAIVDQESNLNIHGCNIGRREPGSTAPPTILKTLSEAFGGDTEAPTVYAPTRIQVYGRQGRQPYEALADDARVTLPIAQPRDADIIRAFETRHGSTPSDGETWASLLPNALRFSNRYDDTFVWRNFQILPERGAIGYALAGRELRNHQALLTTLGIDPSGWQNLTIADWNTTQNASGGSVFDVHKISYSYTIADGRPSTHSIEIQNPRIPEHTTDIVAARHPELVAEYEWRPAVPPRPRGPVGSLQNGSFSFTGQSVTIIILRIIRDAEGRPHHPSRTDTAHYSQYPPPPPTTGATLATGATPTPPTTGATPEHGTRPTPPTTGATPTPPTTP